MSSQGEYWKAMKNDEKMIAAVQELIATHGIGYIMTTDQLVKFIHTNYKMTERSIMPPDYCYNRINNGIGLTKPTLFEYLDRGQYKCLGEGYPYNGDVYHKEMVVGVCENGVRWIFGIPVEPETPLTPKTPKHKKRQRDPSPRLRFEVLARDKFTCRYCGASPSKDPEVTLHIDHIIPWSKGGETTLENLQTLCSKCNLGKSDLIIDIS